MLVFGVQDGHALSWKSWCEDESVAEENECLLVGADSASKVLDFLCEVFSIVPVLLGVLVVFLNILLVLGNGILKFGEVTLNLGDGVVLNSIGGVLEITDVFIANSKSA